MPEICFPAEWMKYLPRKLQVVTEKPSKNFENKGSHMICDCRAILELSFLLQDFAYSCEKKGKYFFFNTRGATNLIGIDLYYSKWEYCEICIFWLQFEKYCKIVRNFCCCKLCIIITNRLLRKNFKIVKKNFPFEKKNGDKH